MNHYEICKKAARMILDAETPQAPIDSHWLMSSLIDDEFKGKLVKLFQDNDCLDGMGTGDAYIEIEIEYSDAIENYVQGEKLEDERDRLEAGGEHI